MIDLENLTHILQQDCRLDRSRPIIVGVSGGPDSLCLLDLLYRIKYPLIVAHLNHGLRDEARAEALVVQKIARDLSLDFVTEEADVSGYARSHSLAIEEAARSLRYLFLFNQARKHLAQAVVVAHTADDQIETILMHMLRGAGLSGLKGIAYHLLPNPWDNEIALVRPLLGIYREDILSYCIDRQLVPVFDRSNLDNTYFRNRIRNELIPLLETYNPGVKANLWRMANLLATDDHFLEEHTSNAWEVCCLDQNDQGVALDINKVAALPTAIQERLIRKAIAKLRPGLRDIDYAAVEKTIEFTYKTKSDAQWDLSDGLCLIREGKALWIANWGGILPITDSPQIHGLPMNLTVPGRIELSGGWHIQSDIIDVDPGITAQATNNNDPYHAWFDFGQESCGLFVRGRSPGDRFQPLGLDGHSVKLSDYLINVKMPRRLRKFWPLVCMGNTILWIPGYRASHQNCLSSSSEKAIHLYCFKDKT